MLEVRALSASWNKNPLKSNDTFQLSREEDEDEDESLLIERIPSASISILN